MNTSAYTRLSSFFYRRPAALYLVFLLPPLLWLGVIYCGSLLAMFLHSFFSIDDFSGVLVRTPTLKTYGELFSEANFGILMRTTAMAAVVSVASAALAFPLAYYMARYAGKKTKALCFIAVMLPLWSSYLVRVYAWKLLLAKEGVVSWFFSAVGATPLLEALLEIPVLGGASLSMSYFGTFLVFLYIWLPYMILPVQAVLERIPKSYIEASADLGASPAQSFRTVIWPLAIPGIAAGSIFTFSLTLGDYIIPSIVGNSRPFLGQAVMQLQGTAGNLPLAAAFSIVPLAVMGLYLWAAKRLGAFDAL